MPIPPVIQSSFMRLADALCDRRSYDVPDYRRLRGCKIVAHRGSCDNRLVMENTMAAFDRAAEAGVWGLEMDIRWTRDQIPVVFHDPDLNRLYGRAETIATFSLNELQRQYPAIPSLREVVVRFGQKTHLMIEVKNQSWPARRIQDQCLAEVLQPLTPVRDFHLMTLDPIQPQPFRCLPPRAWVAIAEGWPGSSSRWVQRHRWGGVCGHYLLVGKTMIDRHHQESQRIGTGYIESCSCLFRELNRGVDWIFSNNAVVLQAAVGQYQRNSD
jgi:glycerophosphoryl diester phosphodiesterase